MTRWKFWWLFLGALLLVPYAILFVTGSLWLYEYGMLWWYLAISVAVSLASSAVMHWMRDYAAARAKEEKSPSGPLGLPSGGDADPNWPPLAKQAWDRVQAIAERVGTEDVPLDQPERVWQICHEVLQTVARQYHPEASQPELETPVPHVLWTVEQVARDLREAFSENVPGSHVFTVGDFWRLTRLTHWYRRFYLLYRVVAAGFNPVSALMREVRDAATDKMVVTSTGDVKQWAIGFCIRRAGFYAIQLYSGQQEWDVAALQAFRSRAAVADLRRAAAADVPAGQEPLRILVAGQVKAGKSSTINALFGATRAAVDVIPCTRNVEPYVLERDGMPLAILLDTIGYEAAGSEDNPFGPLEEELLRCDLVLLVCTALSAARDADRRTLDQLRAFYAGHPDQVMPPVVAVVTHVDQLRPAGQWAPPYDLTRPTGAKARNIAEAVRAVEADLGLSDKDLIVPVCLRPGAEYNVEEGLAPAILNVLPGARAACYLRCLREFRQSAHWRRLWQQARGAGRTLLKVSRAWFGRKKRD